MKKLFVVLGFVLRVAGGLTFTGLLCELTGRSSHEVAGTLCRSACIFAPATMYRISQRESRGIIWCAGREVIIAIRLFGNDIVEEGAPLIPLPKDIDLNDPIASIAENLGMSSRQFTAALQLGKRCLARRQRDQQGGCARLRPDRG